MVFRAAPLGEIYSVSCISRWLMGDMVFRAVPLQGGAHRDVGNVNTYFLSY